MKIFFGVLILGLFFLPLKAQIFKFGDVPLVYLEMNTYENDSAAGAVVLFNYGKAELVNPEEPYVELKLHERIKILSDNEVSRAAISIPFSTQNPVQQITKVKAHSVRLNEAGEIVKSRLKTEDISIEQLSESVSELSFTIPDVYKGSVIEYSYELSTDDPKFYPNWTFQKDIPVIWSEYIARIPDKYIYLTITKGNHPFHIQKYYSVGNISKGTSLGKDFRYVMKDIPALINQPFMKGRSNYLAQIQFVLESIQSTNNDVELVLGEWFDVIDEFLFSDEFGYQMWIDRKSQRANMEAISGTSRLKSVYLQEIFEYVSTRMKWNGEYGLYPNPNVDELLEKGIGNAASINMLLIKMLRTARFEAHPVLVNVRAEEEVNKEVPGSHYFNHVMAYVAIGPNYYIIDASRDEYPFTMVPLEFSGTTGLMIYEYEIIWLKILSLQENKRFSNWDVQLDGETLSATIDVDEKGYYALETREQVGDREYLSDSLVALQFNRNDLDFIQVDSVAIELQDSTEQLEYTIEFTVYDESAGADTIYFYPLEYAVVEEHPFKSETRNFPVDYPHTFDESVVMSITFPEEWKIQSIPQPILYVLPDNGGEFRRIIEVDNNKISLNFRFKIDKIRFMPEEYEVLKGMYDQMVETLQEQIVFIK
ncbi:MAG: DUF3857 domain-containing protein [Balneolaceae bacterium]|nr:DUF3857 domain-containing protein [Balneolaceae bacterium]